MLQCPYCHEDDQEKLRLVQEYKQYGAHFVRCESCGEESSRRDATVFVAVENPAHDKEV